MYRIVVYKDGLYIAKPDEIWATRGWGKRKKCNKEGLLPGEYYSIEKWHSSFLGFCGEWKPYGGKFKTLGAAGDYFDNAGLKSVGSYDDMP